MKTQTFEQVKTIYAQPFMNLLYEAHKIHIANHTPNEIEAATLLSIKTGSCAEDCGYCSQSGHHNTTLKKEKLMAVEEVLEKAKLAKQNGATRFCMGAAWRCPPKKAMPELVNMITAVKKLELETCMTLGLLDEEDAATLKQAGLDFYNHNLDTSEDYYPKIVSTRTYADRLKTISNVQQAGIKVCCGGILGLGEKQDDRISFLMELANLSPQPDSVPINNLVPIIGTPMANNEPVEGIEFVRTVATARILMPKSKIRLSAGRANMSDELQALCFFAGANSIFLGDKLLTTDNPLPRQDETLFEKLGICVRKE